MRKRKAPVPARRDPSSKAISLFGILVVAADDGDFEAAAKVQRTLAELGWVVARRNT
jgi:hypothetical protein